MPFHAASMFIDSTIAMSDAKRSEGHTWIYTKTQANVHTLVQRQRERDRKRERQDRNGQWEMTGSDAKGNIIPICPLEMHLENYLSKLDNATVLLEVDIHLLKMKNN